MVHPIPLKIIQKIHQAGIHSIQIQVMTETGSGVQTSLARLFGIYLPWVKIKHHWLFIQLVHSIHCPSAKSVGEQSKPAPPPQEILRPPSFTVVMEFPAVAPLLSGRQSVEHRVCHRDHALWERYLNCIRSPYPPAHHVPRDNFHQLNNLQPDIQLRAYRRGPPTVALFFYIFMKLSRCLIYYPNMLPAVAGQLMAFLYNFLHHLRIALRHPAQSKESSLCVFIREQLENSLHVRLYAAGIRSQSALSMYGSNAET